MASDRPGDSIVTVVTCEGNFSDPQFPYKLSSLVARLKRLLYTGDQPFRVTNVEPWNSVRVTFNIPREAAQRLRQLAQAGDRVLRDLGILSVQIEGDQVISLTIAGHFNEPQEIVLHATDDDRSRASSQASSAFDLAVDGSRASSNVDGNRKNVVQILAQQGSAEAGAVVATASSSLSSSPAAASNAQESFFTGQLVAQTDFKSPNVVAPKNEPIPFPPKITSPSSRTQTPFVPFPFASMTHAMNTMHGSQLHSSQINTVTQTPYPKFSFSPSSPYPPQSPSSGGGGGGNSSGNSAFQSVKPLALTSVQSPSSTTSPTSSITSSTSVTTTATTSVVNHLQRAVADRANAALTSPLLVNLLQSDLSSASGGSQVAHGGASGLGGKQLAPLSLTEVTKRKRKPRKSKEETITISISDANPGSLRTSPGCSSRVNLNTPSNLECTSNLSLFSQPFNITPLSPPPPLTPPSASPPSLLGQPFVVTSDTILKPSFTSHHHQIPTLPSPPPTAPSSSTSASNNSGQSSLEAEHELSPWPSPSKRTQHLINPFTGQLEPMSSDDDIDDTHEDVRTGSAKDLFESNSGTPSLSLSSSNSSSSLSTFPETVAPTDRSFRSGGETGHCTEPKVREMLSSIKEVVSSTFSSEPSAQQQRTTHSCVSPSSSLSTSGGGSPSEKIKLRLKLDPSCDRQKTESAVTPNLQYKVDVSFVNIPTRRMTGTTSVCENPGLVPVSCSVVTTQSSGCSTSPTTITGSTSPCASSEPRVPPLHISLRGRNAAVVTSPRKDEKDWCSRLTGRTDYVNPPSSVVVGGSDIVSSKVQRSRTSRFSKDAQGKCPSVTTTATPSDISLTTKNVNSSSIIGRRLALSRGGGHSRRSRVVGQNLASQSSDTNVNVQSALVSPILDRSSPSSESSMVSSCPVMAESKEKPSVSPSPQHQPTAAREKALLSGGSLVVEPPLPQMLQGSKKSVSTSATVVTGVQLPKIDVNAEGEVSVTSSRNCLPSQRVAENVEAVSDETPSSSDVIQNEAIVSENCEYSNSMQSPDRNVSDLTNTRLNVVDDTVTERMTFEDGVSLCSPTTTTPTNLQNNVNDDISGGGGDVNKSVGEEISLTTGETVTLVPSENVISSDVVSTTVACLPENLSTGEVCELESNVVTSSESKQEELVNENEAPVSVASQANPREALTVCETKLNAATTTTTLEQSETVISTPQLELSASNDSRETEENLPEVRAVVVVTLVPDSSDVKSEDSKAPSNIDIEKTHLPEDDNERLASCNDVKFLESFKEDVLVVDREVSNSSVRLESMEDETTQCSAEGSVTARSKPVFEQEPLIISTPNDVIVPSVQLALSPPMISSRAEVDNAAPFLTPQGKLRVTSVALGSSNLSCLVTSDGGAVMVEGLPPLSTEEDGESDMDFESTRTTANHHHRHHQISGGPTTVLASINNDSPCSASPSGSSPDSLLTNTGGEESGGDQGNGGISSCASTNGGCGSSKEEQSGDKGQGEEEKDQHQSVLKRNYRGGGSPYEDSGVESMDATTEKSSGGESPCENDNGNYSNVGENNSTNENANLTTDSNGCFQGEVDGLLKSDSVSLDVGNVPLVDSSSFSLEKDKEPEVSKVTSPPSAEVEDVLASEAVEEDDPLSNEIKSEGLELTAKIAAFETSAECEKEIEEGCPANGESISDNQISEEPKSEVTGDSEETKAELAVSDSEENPKKNEDVLTVKVEADVKESEESTVRQPTLLPPSEEKRTSSVLAADEEEETRVFLEGHSINGQGDLLASVVFGEQVMAVSDELACGSPSDATTTQLLVFTVEDGESIVVTEDSEHHMSLLRLTQADTEDSTSTIQFSALESGEESGVGTQLEENLTVIGEPTNSGVKETTCDDSEVAATQVASVTESDENHDRLSADDVSKVNESESAAETASLSSPLQSTESHCELNDTLKETSEKVGPMQPLSLPQISPVLNCGVLNDDDPAHCDALVSEAPRSVALPIKFVALPSILNSHLTRQGSTTASEGVGMLTTTNAVDSTSSTTLKMLINRNSPTPDDFHSVADVSRRCSLTPPLLKHHHNQAPPLSPKIRCVNDSVIFSPLASTSSMLTPLHSEESQSSPYVVTNLSDAPSVTTVVNRASVGDSNLYHTTIRRKLGYDDLDGIDSDSSTSSMSNDLTGDYKDQEEGDGDCFMGITSVTSGDHNYIFRASSMPKRLRGTKMSQTPPPGHHTNSNSSNSVETIESISVPEDANGDLSINESDCLAQLSVEIPNDEPETDRRSTRNTRSNSMLCSPDKCSSTAQSSPDSSHSNSHSRNMNTNDLEESEEIETVDGAVHALPNRVGIKRRREDSDSDGERKGSSGVLLTLPSDVVITTEKEDKEPTTNSTIRHMYTKPVKRKCSENAVELIKACIGVEDVPKRPGNVKQPVIDGTRHTFNRNAKSKEDINKTKVGQYSTVTTSEGSSDDEVTLSELVTKTRAVKSKQVTTNVEYPAATPRNVTRNAKQKQKVKEAGASSGVIDEELGRIASAGSRGKNGRAVATSRKESRKDGKEGSGSRGGNRGGRALEKTNNKKLKEQNDQSSAPSIGASTLPPHTSAQNKPSSEEVGGGKRKLRSSGPSGYYSETLPQKRRRFSRDNR